MMTRRSLLAAAPVAALPAWAADLPVIDTHIHLFDPGRSQGVPWPPKNSKIYKAALPDRYRALVKPFNVKGAIMVECSPWFDDNQWVLDLIQKDPIMVGMIGDLEPDHAEFPKQLERFRKNPLYLGIRYGNLWDRNFHAKVSDPAFLKGVKLLADAGLTMDTANPDPPLIADLLRLTERVPNLRLVVDHLPKLEVPKDAAARKAYEKDLTELAKRPLSYSKVSAVLRTVDGKVPTDLAFYKDRLDFLFGAFGEDRVVYGSDWPNSDLTAEYPAVFKIVSDYFATKTPAQREKYFWRNSVKAYRWKKRDGSQPG
jgi:predicted TIM-barrel fold metal-dependent hydrolase